MRDQQHQKKTPRKVAAGLSYVLAKNEMSKRNKNPDDNLLILLGIADAVEHRQLLDKAKFLAMPALAIGSFLAGLQFLVWGVARRRVHSQDP